LCRRFGISRTTGYKWLERYRREGSAGLIERSRRPNASPLRTTTAVNAWGERKIKRTLEDRGETGIPAASTITEIMRRHDRLTEAGSAEHPGPWTRFERASPNELWQMDFKGHFATHAGRCHPLTALDDHSRYNLILAACGDEQGATVRGRLEEAFRRYGLPLAMLMDGGSRWSDPGGDPLTRFSVWLMRLGVRVAHGRPYHPRTQGKEERFHRTFKAEVTSGRSFPETLPSRRAIQCARSTATASSASRTGRGASANPSATDLSPCARPPTTGSAPCTIAPTGSKPSTGERPTARPADLWTTLRIAQRVHRKNSNSRPPSCEGKCVHHVSERLSSCLWHKRRGG
jgi:transposase InsO family protein